MAEYQVPNQDNEVLGVQNAQKLLNDLREKIPGISDDEISELVLQMKKKRIVEVSNADTVVPEEESVDNEQLSRKDRLNDTFDKYLRVNDKVIISSDEEKGFLEKHEPVRKALELLRNNLSLLEEMPILPSFDSDSLLEKKELADRQVTKVDNVKVAEFVNKLGGLDLDANIYLLDLNSFLDIDSDFYYSAFEQYDFDLDTQEDIGYISIRKLLEITRVRVFGDEYVTSQYNEARSSLEKYTPELLTDKPVVAVFDPDTMGSGRYIGEVDGKHYVVTDAKGLQANPYISMEHNPEDTSTIEHEMVHAAHAEAIGPAFFGMEKPFDDYVDFDADDDPITIAKKIDNSMYDIPDNEISIGNNLQLTVAEGSAILSQLYLYNKKIENSDDGDTKQEVMKMRRNFLARLRFRDNVRNKQYDQDDIYVMSRYRDGVNILKPLYKQFGLENMTEIVKSINWDKLGDIKEGSEEYASIIQDPRLMPGLEDNAIISESLK
jgi:hypothetical protein